MGRAGWTAASTLLLSFNLMAAERRSHPDLTTLVVAEGPSAASERTAIVAALRELPRLPARVAVIDARDAVPEVRQRLLGLDAFVLRGSPVVYVLRHSELLKGARSRSLIHVLALAAAIWHEMAHVEGAEEAGARAREEALWTSFVRDQRLDMVTALRYLTAMARRPDDRLLALR